MENILTRIRNAARLFGQAFSGYTPQFLIIIAVGFFASLLEGLGISAIVPIFSFVTGGGGVAGDPITAAIMRLFEFIGVPYTFRFLILFVGVLFVVRIISLFAIQNITARIVFGYAQNMRERILRSTLEARWPFLSVQKVGHLDQLLSTNTVNVSQFFGIFSTLVMIFTKTVAYLLIAVNISPVIALLSFVVGGLLFFGLKPLFGWNKAYSTEAEELNRRLAHFASQHVVGMKTIKALRAEWPALQAAKAYFERMRNININMVMLRGSLEVAIQFAGLAFVAGVFAYMYRSGSFNFAAFGVIVYAINQIFTQIQAAQVQIHSISMVLPYLTFTQNYILSAEKEQEVEEGKRHATINDGVTFDRVSFSYPGRADTLKDVSFEIRRGEMVAIVGPSGAGKSTIADLLLRFAEHTGGSIEVDGEDIGKIALAEWRQSVGYVTQDSFLLNDTIRNNISFYDTSFTEEDIVEAARSANIHDFIRGLPHGYDAIVGDRGVLISGGERQRIALARVLLRKPKLLILDEATSSLDADSKRAIHASLLALRGSTTVVVIAHSDPIVRKADTIVVVQNGTVKEVTSPERLSAETRAFLSRSYSPETGEV